MSTSPNPFAVKTELPLVAIVGRRAGYVQLAPALETTTYQDLPESMLLAARDWAVRLEAAGAKRVYWITLSEMVRHLHIHLYPRWEDTELKGLPLFEQRESESQPVWNEALLLSLQAWADEHRVHLIR